MAGAGGDLTTTVATAHTRITLIVTIGVIITATTTINDDDSRACERRSLTSALIDRRREAQLDVRFTLKADISAACWIVR